jgi:hypothetical protein
VEALSFFFLLSYSERLKFRYRTST